MNPRPPIKNLYPPDVSRSEIYAVTDRHGRALWYLRENWTEFGPFRERRQACAYQRAPFWRRVFNPKGWR